MISMVAMSLNKLQAEKIVKELYYSILTQAEQVGLNVILRYDDLASGKIVDYSPGEVQKLIAFIEGLEHYNGFNPSAVLKLILKYSVDTATPVQNGLSIQRDNAVIENARLRKVGRIWMLMALIIMTVLGVLLFSGRISSSSSSSVSASVYYAPTSSQAQLALRIDPAYSLVVWTSIKNSCSVSVSSWGYDAKSNKHGHELRHQQDGLTKFVVQGGSDVEVRVSCQGPMYEEQVPTSTVSSVFSDMDSSATHNGVKLPRVGVVSI